MKTNNEDDNQLVSQAVQGDHSSLNKLLEVYRPRLRRMVDARFDNRLLGRVDPSDVVQQAMERAVRRFPDFVNQKDHLFFPWLRQIAHNQLIDLHRRHLAERRSVLRERSMSLPVSEGSAMHLLDTIARSSSDHRQRVEQEELKEKALQALDELSENDREVLVMRHLEQLSVDEIACVLKISKSAVTTRCLRALQRLRSNLGEIEGMS